MRIDSVFLSPAPNPSRTLLRALAFAGAAAFVLSSCYADPPSLTADKLDRKAIAAATSVSLPEYSGSILQTADPQRPNPDPRYTTFRADIERAGLVRAGPAGTMEMTGSGLASVWRVRPGEASWVVGRARIDRVLGYNLVDTGNLDSRVCCGLAYQAQIGTEALDNTGGTGARQVTVQGLAPNLWGRSPPTPERWFDAEGGLLVSPGVMTSALADSLRVMADAPPVEGVREWEDSHTAQCPNAADIDRLRAQLRPMLFAIPPDSLRQDRAHEIPPERAQMLDEGTARRFIAGEFDTRFDQDERFFVLTPAAATARALSDAFAECARSAAVDAHASAWADLWAQDLALLWGDRRVAAPKQVPDGALYALERVRKSADLVHALEANAQQRLAAVRALEQSRFPDVAAYARWVRADKAGVFNNKLSFSYRMRE